MINLPDIPRFYSALAEWLAAMLAIMTCSKRYSRWYASVISVCFLGLQCLVMVPTGDLPDLLWLLCMLATFSLMFLNIALNCKGTRNDIIVLSCRAFVLAEFMASFEWQLYTFICQQQGWDVLEHQSFEFIFLGTVYGLILFVVYLPARQYSNREIHAKDNETITVMFITLSVFILSNVSYLNPNTPFSGQVVTDVFYIRTLVDLFGLAALYAYHIQCMENETRYELAATTSLLDNQYQQYRISKESIDLVNRKYHDLKHQIAALREEKDPQRRAEWLDEMENDIRIYEAQNKTGNRILDTVLTAKSLHCQKLGIALTCVADGSCLDFMKTKDIVAIFGNALDNAIEGTDAVKEPDRRLIHLTLTTQKGFVLIQVENYFGGEITLQDGLPKTTKTDEAYHGFGVKSIRATAQSYGGTTLFSEEDGWFVLKILIPIPADEKA